MQLLKERIVKDGLVNGDVVKVDCFLNHQMDIHLFEEFGKEFKRRFADCNINKILTIEASGIGIACIIAQQFDVPVVFAKKTPSKNIQGEVFTSEVKSFTKNKVYTAMVSKRFLSEQDNILIIDDFLANGCALKGLIELCEQAGATVCGAGIIIEKGFQAGGKMIRDMGVRLESLAIIDKVDEDGTITFRD